MANNNVIISRIQNRRGLKQDLPQPLRAGELGFAVDSKQVFIGSDLSDSVSSGYNKTLSFENTTGAKDTLKSIANNQIVTFTVPHIRYAKGEFDGQTKTVSYTPSTSKTYTLSDSSTNTRRVFNANVTNTHIVNIGTNLSFKAEEITVTKNGAKLTGQNSPTIATVPDSGKDYILNANSDLANTHTVTFRTSPETTDEIGITYYGNSAVIQTLDGIESGISDANIYVGSSDINFYNQYQVPSYRQINSKYIRVNGETGRGYIGLQYKHISVTADSNSVIDTSSLTFGNLLVSRDSQVENGAAISQSGNVATITVSSGHLYNVSSYFNFVYIQNAGATDWINNKALPVDTAGATSLEITLPSGNSWQTGRAVTTNIQDSGTVTITGSTDGLTNGDYVVFSGANASYFDDGTPYVVSNKTATSFQVTESNVSVAISGGLDYINYGSNSSGANVQIISANHGLPNGAPIDLLGSSNATAIGNAQFTTVYQNANTYFIPANTAVVGNVTGTSNVVLVDSAVSHTPVRSIDLSGATTLSEAVGVVSALSDDYAWQSLNIVPDTSNKVYFTHKEAYSSVPLEFHLHEDSVGTLGELKLTPGAYDKEDTIKAKLELFLHSSLESTDVNVYESVSTNQKYNPSATNLNSYTLDIDDTFDEMDFNSRGEAKDFSYIVNNLYYEKSSSDVKGIVNLKTNIELLTSRAASALSATSSYDTPSSATISAAGTSQNIATFNITGGSPAYDSFIVDYSVNYAGSTQNYQRVGTLYLTGFDNSSSGNANVSITDRSADVTDMAGNTSLVFGASVANNIITLNVVHGLGQVLKFNYLTKRWNSR